MSQSTVTFSSGCGAVGPSAFGFCGLGLVPGTMVSSARLAFARPPQAMNAMFSLLFRFCPRRNAGAATTAPAARARATNSRRVMVGESRVAFLLRVWEFIFEINQLRYLKASLQYCKHLA